MKTRLRALLGVGLLGLAAPAWASDEAPAKTSVLHSTFESFLLGEIMIVGNAWMATLDPQVYGGILALFGPFGAAESGRTNPALGWVSVAAVEGLAIYNIVGLDKDEDSKSKIFRDNFIGWHVFGGILFTAGYLMKDDTQEQTLRFQYTPLQQGGFMELNWRF